MEEILTGMLKFLASVIEGIMSNMNTKKAIIYGFGILAVCTVIVYILTKNN